MKTRAHKSFARAALVCSLGFTPVALAQDQPPADPLESDVTQGALRVKTANGAAVECPLRHTDVKAEISGFIARVKVTQTFYNPYDEKIEAVYVFPLPHTAAVNDMTMVVGERRVVGIIKRRAEARSIYEQALRQGLTASLLEQERSNIFTQSVGNIKPRQEIRVEISYVDVLKYDMGTYEFHFPMVVGPRYIPGAPISKKAAVPDELKGKVGEVKAPTDGPDPKGTGWAPDTTRVSDASRITPPVLKPGYRNGHDISLSVNLDSGVPVNDIQIVNHEAELKRLGNIRATATLARGESVPNKDFVMRYSVIGEKPEMALLAHAPTPGHGYFMLMIQPKIDQQLAQAPPREIVFLIDVSGSMNGAPTEKVKQSLREFFKLSKPDDTLQVITFAGHASKLFDKAVPATEDNVAKAMNFTAGIRGSGGTEMLKGIQMVLNEPVDPQRVRIVVMLTDGYIGNEAEIIAVVGRRAGDQIRFWCLGIGSSPNRFLVDGIAKQGGGASAVIDLNSDPFEIVRQIVERIHRAQLAKIEIDWKGLRALDTYPRRIPELWAGRPVILFGRYDAGGSARIELKGLAEGKPISYALDVTLPPAESAHDVLAKVWARNKIEELSALSFYADEPELAEEITEVALEYRLMSQYTSFVAVDESEAGDLSESATPPRRMIVPVPLPEGVSFEGVFGEETEWAAMKDISALGAGVKTRGGAALAVARPKSARYANVGSPTAAQQPLPASVAAAPAGPMANFASSRARVSGKTGAGIPLRAQAGERLKSELKSVKGFAMSQPTIASRFAYFFDGNIGGELGWIHAGLQKSSPQRHEEARKALAEAQELQKKGALDAARLRFQHTFLLETAFLCVNPWSDDGTKAAAEQALRALPEDITKQRAKESPQLIKKLDLVLRDQPLEEALRAVAKAAGLKLQLVEGSLADVATILDNPELRVTYLDLRRATVAQALDWLLTLFHLSWATSKDTLVVGTTRRMDGDSPWVYAIGDFALPTEKELGTADQQKKVEKALTDFLDSVGLVLNQKDDSGLAPRSAVLIDPARLLVYGDKGTHAKVATFLTALQDAKADVSKPAGRNLTTTELRTLQVFHMTAAARWNERAGEREKRVATLGRQRVLAALDDSSWRLLAGACRNKVDLEALTHLRVAFRDAKLREILDGPYAWVALRAAWAATEAARTVPGDAELRTFATNVLRTTEQQSAASWKALETKPDDRAAYLRALYSALTLRNAKALKVNLTAELAEAEKSLTRQAKGTPLEVERVVSALLLKPSLETDSAFGAAVGAQRFVGDDLVVLASVAAKNRGGAVWKTFREEMPEFVAKQPLNSNVRVLVNRLEAATLASLID